MYIEAGCGMMCLTTFQDQECDPLCRVEETPVRYFYFRKFDVFSKKQYVLLTPGKKSKTVSFIYRTFH